MSEKPKQRLEDPFLDDLIFKRKPVKNPYHDEGGAGDLYSTAMALTEGLAALNSKHYAPAAAAARVAELSHAAAPLLDTGLAPSPFGSSSPDVTPSHSERFVRNPNKTPESYDQGMVREVVLQANQHHGYYTKGLINGHRVEFLVDTGASSVSIPYRIADALGLKPTGRAQKAQTANGIVTVYETSLEQLVIGNIELYQVKASINTGDKSDQILLGMSALKELEMVHRGGEIDFEAASLTPLRKSTSTPSPSSRTEGGEIAPL